MLISICSNQQNSPVSCSCVKSDLFPKIWPIRIVLAVESISISGPLESVMNSSTNIAMRDVFSDSASALDDGTSGIYKVIGILNDDRLHDIFVSGVSHRVVGYCVTHFFQKS